MHDCIPIINLLICRKMITGKPSIICCLHSTDKDLNMQWRCTFNAWKFHLNNVLGVTNSRIGSI